jgi:hypothetical protein
MGGGRNGQFTFNVHGLAEVGGCAQCANTAQKLARAVAPAILIYSRDAVTRHCPSFGYFFTKKCKRTWSYFAGIAVHKAMYARTAFGGRLTAIAASIAVILYSGQPPLCPGSSQVLP